MTQAGDVLASLVGDFEQYARAAVERAVASITAPPPLVIHYGVNDERTPNGPAAPTSSPRLQLRWSCPTGEDDRFTCSYELVFPLREHDIRTEDCEGGSAVIELGRTKVGAATAPWTHSGPATARMPYRDGSHAHWDSDVLGLPVFIIFPDGTSERVVKPESAS